MENRIRVAALIFKSGKILLVKHVHPKTGFAWWVPPGGGLQGRETLFECGQREVMEETGLSITFDKIVYIRQFLSSESRQNNLEVFLSTCSFKGKETIENIHGKGEDEHFIKELRYFSKDELKGVTVYPEILKDEMWKDYRNGFPEMRFLGVQIERE